MKYKKNKNVTGTTQRPRLSVFRSNLNIYAQIIDDEVGVTVASSSSIKYKGGQNSKIAVKVGKDIAEEAKKKKIKKVVFDRGLRQYKGNIKTFAESARESGLEF